MPSGGCLPVQMSGMLVGRLHSATHADALTWLVASKLWLVEGEVSS